MIKKGKGKRVDLGTFEAPPRAPLAPVERVVEEGVLISASTVRMAIKNRLIIAALREGNDFDADALAEAARGQFALLARENDDTADRLEQLREIQGEMWIAEDDEVRRAQQDAHRRRPQVHRLLAVALRAEAEDDAMIRRLVEQSRTDAWDEIGREITSQLRLREFDAALDPTYQRDRIDRMGMFIAFDLAALEFDR